MYKSTQKHWDKDVVPSMCLTKTSASVMINLHRVCLYAFAVCCLYCILHISSLTQQLSSLPTRFASSHPFSSLPLIPPSLLPPLLFPLSPLFLLPLPFQGPYGGFSSSSFMLNLFLSFIPHPSAFSPLYILVFGGYPSSVRSLCVCVCRLCRVDCQTSCLKTEGIKIESK